MNTSDYMSIIRQFPRDRMHLLQMLHTLQNHHPQQYLPKETLMEVSRYLNLTLATVYGVVTYYSMFSITPRGKYILRVCQSPVCSMMGSESILDFLKDQLHVGIGETTADGLFTLESCECLGRCGKAPSMMVNNDSYTGLTPESLDQIINTLRVK